jgi:hypothetical protein
MTSKEMLDAVRRECKTHDPDCFNGEHKCPLVNKDSCVGNLEEHEIDDADLVEWYNLCYPNAPIECNTEPEEVIENTTEEVDDPINPNHYTKHGMECIDEMLLVFGKDAVKWFCLCNAWKYRKRAMWKNGKEDIEKSDWYIAKYKELQELEGA